MQTLYYSTSNWIRHTDNIVDLEQYRRKLSQAEDHQPAEGPELIVLPQPSAPRTRRSQRLRRRARLVQCGGESAGESYSPPDQTASARRAKVRVITRTPMLAQASRRRARRRSL